MIELFPDHETELIGRGKLAPPIVCTSFGVGDGPVEVVLWEDTPAEVWLSDPTVIIDGANIAYDLTCEMAADPKLIPLVVDAYCSGRVRDVQLDWKLLDIAEGLNTDRSYGLDKLAEAVGIKLEKENWRKRFGALKDIPIKYWPEGAVNYSRWDAIAGRACRRHIAARAAKWEQAGIIVHGQHAALSAAAAWALHLASCWGVCTDPARTEALCERVHGHIDEIRGDLVNAGLVRRRGSSADVSAWNKRLRAAEKAHAGGGLSAKNLLEIQNDGCPDGKRCDIAAAHRMVEVMTRAGRRQRIELTKTGEAYLQARVKRGEDRAQVHEEYISRLEYVKLDKDAAILSADELLISRADYVTSNLLVGRAERMRKGFVYPLQTRFDSLKDTFRTSSSQPSEEHGLEGEQMQNFPQGEKEQMYGLREVFTPRTIVPCWRDGRWDEDEGVFIGADYAMFELHALSEVAQRVVGFSNMGRLLNAGVDVHYHFGAKSLGITIEQLKAREDAKKHRNRAKPLNFGVPGGMGAEMIVTYSRKSYGVKFDLEEVKELRRIWLYDTFPEVPELFKWTNAQLNGHSSFTHIHPITGYVRGGCGYTDGNNENFQHLAAYAAKVAIVEVTRACFTPDSPLFGWRMWNYVHDELLLEGPRSGAIAAARELSRIMVDCANRFMPNHPCKASPFVTKIWSKKEEHFEWQEAA